MKTVPERIKRIPEVRQLAEIRAEEISNGEKTLEQLSEFDQESCWFEAEAEAISRAERYMVRN